MTEGERLRAQLARAARAGGGGADGPVDLRAALERLDATVLPRCLTIAAGGTTLALAVAERRLLAVNGAPGPDGPEAAAQVGLRLAHHLARDPAPCLVEGPWPTGVTRDPSRGLSARAIAASLGVDLWPDRSLAARLERWVIAVQHRTRAGAGYGALADAALGWGDDGAVARAIARLAPDGPAALMARGLAGPAGGAAGEAVPGLVACAGADGSAVLVAGSPEGGVAVLARLEDLPDLIRDWQVG
ncbi:MAG: hypothetical protein MUF73_19990 [Rhodobacteraceae bacterium]|jgi:hypothetical protein|nr:hypothetical protein [Paracoccaceae bacterium]